MGCHPSSLFFQCYIPRSNSLGVLLDRGSFHLPGAYDLSDREQVLSSLWRTNQFLHRYNHGVHCPVHVLLCHKNMAPFPLPGVLFWLGHGVSLHHSIGCVASVVLNTEKLGCWFSYCRRWYRRCDIQSGHKLCYRESWDVMDISHPGSVCTHCEFVIRPTLQGNQAP